MSLTTAGLTDIGLGKGVTPCYAISYDPTLPNGTELTNGLLAKCDADLGLMREWFGGVGIPFQLPLGVQINNASGGASWKIHPLSRLTGSVREPLCRLILARCLGRFPSVFPRRRSERNAHEGTRQRLVLRSWVLQRGRGRQQGRRIVPIFSRTD